MAIVPELQPDRYALAYNDNVYVWKTTAPTPTKRFEVTIFDLALASIAKLIVYPIATDGQTTTPDKAYVDVSRIIQSRIGHDVEIPSALQNGFYANTNSHLEYTVLVKEQDVSSTGAYYTLPNWHFFKQKSVWNGVQNIDAWLDFDSLDYRMTTGAGTTKFLSDASNIREIESNQSAFLYFVSVGDNAPSAYELITYDGYDGSGSVINTTQISNSFATNMSSSWRFRYLRIPIGTYDIPLIDPARFSSGSPSTILNGAKSYTIKLEDNTGATISETITFNIDQECSKYDGVRLHWLNRLGGFDSFNFSMKSSESTGAKRKNYRQQHHTWTGTNWNYNKQSRGKTEYDIQTTKKIKVNTGYLNDSDSVLMESLFASPEIYQEVNNELYAVNLNGKSIEKKTSLNDKLSQYTFDLEYSLINYRQRG